MWCIIFCQGFFLSLYRNLWKRGVKLVRYLTVLLTVSMLNVCMGAEKMSVNYKFQSVYFDTPIVKGRVLDIFEPHPGVERKESALFIVHGGGWRGGSREKFHEIMEKFVEQGYTVCSTDYRLYAKDAFEQIRDVRDGYMIFAEYLKSQSRPVKIFVYGESAGSHLASMVVCSDLEMVDNWVKPAGGIFHATPCSFVPWEGMMDGARSMMRSIAGVDYKSNPEVYEKLSLTNHISKDDPQIFFMEAELEHMFFPEYTLKEAHKLQKFGVPVAWKMYRNMEHGFFYTLNREAQREALRDIMLFMDGKLELNVPEKCVRYQF